MLSTLKSYLILCKHKGYNFISECLALNWYIFTEFTYKKKLLLKLYCKLHSTIFFFVKSLEYLASAVVIVSSVSCVGSSLRTKIFFIDSIHWCGTFTSDNATYVQRGHWESRVLLLTCIFQQYLYKFKSIFKTQFKYKNIIFLSAWLAKHVDGQDSCKLLSLNACCTYTRSNIANSNMCMI